MQRGGLRFRVFSAANDPATANVPTRELLKRYFPEVPITRELGEFEAPLSNRKAREVLGFKESHNWRKYVAVGSRFGRARAGGAPLMLRSYFPLRGCGT